jgi:hypothetical protein
MPSTMAVLEHPVSYQYQEKSIWKSEGFRPLAKIQLDLI